MKKIVLIVTLVIFFLATGCKNTTISKASNNTPKPNKNKIFYEKYEKDCYGNGNSVGNISNYGTACEDTNYIYYSITYGATGIYKMNYDGSNKTKLTSDKAYYLNSDKDFLYYRNVSDEGRLYKNQ